jgi:hypothetical protein
MANGNGQTNRIPFLTSKPAGDKSAGTGYKMEKSYSVERLPRSERKPAMVQEEVTQRYRKDQTGREVPVGPPSRRLVRGTKEEQAYFKNSRNKVRLKAFVGTSPVPDH